MIHVRLFWGWGSNKQAKKFFFPWQGAIGSKGRGGRWTTVRVRAMQFVRRVDCVAFPIGSVACVGALSRA